MRPRVFPAEDAGQCGPPMVGGPVRFNEAAGIPRGRPGPSDAMESLRHASMRPRVFPAEDEPCARIGNMTGKGASMRPRVFPAEDDGGVATTIPQDMMLQ